MGNVYATVSDPPPMNSIMFADGAEVTETWDRVNGW